MGVYEQLLTDHNLDGQQPEIYKMLMKLMSIKGISLSVTELSQALTIDEVTDIFICINFKYAKIGLPTHPNILIHLLHRLYIFHNVRPKF